MSTAEADLDSISVANYGVESVPPVPEKPQPSHPISEDAAPSPSALPRPKRVGLSPFQIRWANSDNTWAWLLITTLVGYFLNVFFTYLTSTQLFLEATYGATVSNLIGSIIMGYVEHVSHFIPSRKNHFRAFMIGLAGSLSSFSGWIVSATEYIALPGTKRGDLFLLCLFNGTAHGLLGLRLGQLIARIVCQLVYHGDKAATASQEIAKRDASSIGLVMLTPEERAEKQRLAELEPSERKRVQREKREQKRAEEKLQREQARGHRRMVNEEVKVSRQIRDAQISAWKRGEVLSDDEIHAMELPPERRTAPEKPKFSFHILIIYLIPSITALILLILYCIGKPSIFDSVRQQYQWSSLLLGIVFAYVGVAIRFGLSFLNFKVIPLGTFICNMAAIVLAMTVRLWWFKLPESAQFVTKAFTVGLCSTLSTLSSFALEVSNLKPWVSMCYYLLSVAVGVTISAVMFQIKISI